MAGQHTPGPWIFTPHTSGTKGDYWVHSCGASRGVAILWACSLSPDRRVDAALIAAAPDLLAACKTALQFVARHTPLVDSDVPIVGEVADQFDAMAMQLRAAIAKAEGGAA